MKKEKTSKDVIFRSLNKLLNEVTTLFTSYLIQFKNLKEPYPYKINRSLEYMEYFTVQILPLKQLLNYIFDNPEEFTRLNPNNVDTFESLMGTEKKKIVDLLVTINDFITKIKYKTKRNIQLAKEKDDKSNLTQFKKN